MTKQEQIEEMTKERNEIKDIMKLLDKCVSLNPMYKSEVASVLYGNNYRKLPEDSVVLSREELSKALTDNFNMGKKEAQFYSERVAIPTTRKETAEKFLQLAYDRSLEKSFIKKVENLAKQFGVEIKE